MTLPLRPALALLAVAVLSLGTLHSWGFYTPWAFVSVMVALLLAVRACVGKSEAVARDNAERRDGLPILLSTVALVLGVAAPFATGLMYETSRAGADKRVVHAAVMAVMTAGAAGFWLTSRSFRWRHLVWPLGLFVGGLTLRGLTILSSPEPVIDVYNLLRDGADHIIDGKNPYASDIVSPYGTPRARRFGVADPADPRPAGYPPLPLLLAIPPRLLGLDVRWSNVAADLIAAAAILAVALRRRRPWVGVLAAGIYLNLPRVPFLIEQAWYEPMIAALLGVGLLLAELCGWVAWPGYILIGLGLTAKQFGLPLLLPLTAAHWRRWPLIVLGLAAGGLVMLPWIVWSPRDFFDIILFKHLGRPLQPQSITVGSFLLNEFGATMPRIVGWLLAGGAIAGISLVTPRGSAAAALGLGTALLAFSVLHTQGFPNYFYLVQYLWLLGAVSLLPRADTEVRLDATAGPAA